MKKRSLLETLNRFHKLQQRIANKYQCKVSITTAQGRTVIVDGRKRDSANDKNT
jgi:hypothetical protein